MINSRFFNRSELIGFVTLALLAHSLGLAAGRAHVGLVGILSELLTRLSVT